MGTEAAKRMAQYREYLKEQEREKLESATGLISDFIEFSATKGIVLQQSNFSYIQPIGICAEYPDILYRLSNRMPDKEGLFREAELLSEYTKSSFLEGFYDAGNYMPMAHPFFRRGYYEKNNFFPRFIEKFWNLSVPAIEKYIALDSNRVRINVDNTAYKEFDTWYGAPFSQDIAQIKNGVVVLAPPAGASYLLFGDVVKLDILWDEAGGIKTFQAEEICNDEVVIEIGGRKYHPVKYIHSEYDLHNSHFRHLDGAVHLYTPEEYAIRKNSDMNFNSKNNRQVKACSTKLFKMDGDISVDIWAEYVGQFFSGNPLVHEYFTGHYPEHVQKMMDEIARIS